MSAALAVGLRCEWAVNPLGIDMARPALSWQMRDDRRGAKQTAYQVRVGSTPDGADLWDSGKVESDESVGIAYAGKKPRSRQRCFWQVKLWDHEGVETAWSEPAHWEMAITNPREWAGEWITVPVEFDAKVSPPAKYLRRAFAAKGPITQARLYLTARGIYEPYINGQRLGAQYFAPGWSAYTKRLRYQCYDVTALLAPGENVLGAIVGDGWYVGTIGWVADRGHFYGKNTALLGQLHIEYADGSREVIATDGQWRAGTGPILAADLLMGETYDARKEIPGWCTAAFDGSGWQAVETSPRDEVILEPYRGPGVTRHEELPVRDAWQTADGKWILDLGQNMVGVVRLKVQGAAGTTITLRHAEMLNPDRTLYLTNLRRAKATDHYILKGEGEETYEPRFTSHGFRYVELSATDPNGTPFGIQNSAFSICGVVLHSAIEPTGQWTCSNDKLNQLQHNIVWGQKGNFVELPTDCPQRDERLGWMGDAQVFIRTAAFNMDVATFFKRWMIEVDDAQLSDGAFTDIAPDIISGGKTAAWGSGVAAWGDAGVICPWVIYQVYGDRGILERHFPAMLRWIEFMTHRSEGLIRPDFGYGDWLAIGSDTPKPLIQTAYFAGTTALTAQIAEILGKRGDARRLTRLYKDIKKAFQKEFVTPAGRIIGHSQTADVLALRFGLVDGAQRAAVIRHLCADIEARGVLTTGFVGVNLLLPTLSSIGRDDLAFKLLLNEKFPSWLFSVNHGATTIWERWDGWTPEKGFQDPAMNSFNHYAYGSCGEWMYAHIAGIDLDAASPGYKHAIIHPKLGGGLTWARGALDTVHGPISTAWRVENGTFTLEVAVPANTRATVILPTKDPQAVTESAKSLAAAGVQVQEDSAGVRCEVPAGRYVFAVAGVAAG